MAETKRPLYVGGSEHRIILENLALIQQQLNAINGKLGLAAHKLVKTP